MKESNSNSRSEDKGKSSSSKKSKGKPASKIKFEGFNKNKSNTSNDSQSSDSNRGSRGSRSDRNSEGSRNERSGGDSRPNYGAPRNERSGGDSRSDRNYGGSRSGGNSRSIGDSRSTRSNEDSRSERSRGDSKYKRSYGGSRSGGDSRNTGDSWSSRSYEGSRSERSEGDSRSDRSYGGSRSGGDSRNNRNDRDFRSSISYGDNRNERSGVDNRSERSGGDSRPSRSYGNSRSDRYGNRLRPNRSGGGSFRSGGRNGGGENSRGRGVRFKKTRLDPTTLVNTSIKIKEERAEVVTRSFAKMEIHPKLQSRIERKGYVNSTEIQDKTFEIIMAGHSVMGIANTGTGKTGAFLIPILNKILSEKKSAKTIILVPTRELAEQVEQELKSLTKGLKVFSSVFIGGTSVRKDLDKLRRPNDVVIGTPGRINDLIDRRALKLFDFSKIVLDEFDTMLDMGFLQDVTKVIDQMHKRDQTILFSATENSKQQNIIDGIIDDYHKVSVSSGEANTDNIYQEIIKTRGDDDKFDILADLLDKEEFEKVLIFLETKRQVSKLFMRLKQYGVRIDEIHGDKTQMYRSKAVRKFKSGAIKVLVATDVASRGIDIDNVTHVINYEIPSSRESYIHRIGRTGRAGKSGNAITFY
jgi:ATP-dependent RNA helicase RhlE